MSRDEKLLLLTAAALQGLLVNEKYVPGMDLPKKEVQIVGKAVAYAAETLRRLEE